ncbi:MAG: molybdopterin oxidoreductase family protein [Planctomycetota bacterium]
MAHVVKTVCSHDCPDACSVLVTVDGEGEDARAVQFRGDPDHPFTRGYLCGKVNTYDQVVYDPDRLLHPLKRSGPKGSGSFERISWDEAIDTVAAKFVESRDQFGGESIFQYYYAGTMGIVHRFCGDALFNKLGASQQRPNICYYGADAGYQSAVGASCGLDPEDTVHSDLIIIWGCNVVTTQVHLMKFFDEARAKGAKILAIDPYRNRTAKRADTWIPIRPGTDTALALGVMHILDRDGKTNADFLANRTVGYDELREKTLPNYSPAHAAEITGVSESAIEALATQIAAATAPLFKVGIGLGRSSHGGTAVRSICSLAGSVGAYEKLGGGVLYDSGVEFRFNLDAVKRPDWLDGSPRVFDQTEFGPLLNQADPPIRCLYVHGSNPAATAPLQDQIRRGLAREDLFTVVHERVLTDTALYADIVLPAPTFAETADLFKSYGHLYAQFGKQSIEPLGEARSNLDVVQALGKAMGFDDPWFDKSVEDFVREIVAATDDPNFKGLNVDSLLDGETFRLNIPSGVSAFAESFPTTSGRLEIRSDELESRGMALPEYRGDTFADELTDADSYPLKLITPPAHSYLNSSFCQLEKARRREKIDPQLLIHPEDAQGLETGTRVEVTSENGSVEAVALVTDTVVPGTVVAEGTWWPRHSPGGKGINTLTSNRLTDLGGGSTFHDNRVSVRAVGS